MILRSSRVAWLTMRILDNEFVEAWIGACQNRWYFWPSVIVFIVGLAMVVAGAIML